MPLTEEQARVAMSNPEHLKRWLAESGRKFANFNLADLVDALAWPGEDPDRATVIDFQRVVELYSTYRQTVPTGRTETQADSEGNPVEVPIMKGEVLEPEEKLELYNQLKAELAEAGILA